MPDVLSALTPDAVENLTIALVVVFAFGAAWVIRSTFKLYSKIAIVVVLAGLGVALFQNRFELGRCSQTCACAIYGYDVEVPHLPFSCDY